MIARSTGEKFFNVFNILVLAMFAFLALYPFLYTVSISLSSKAEADREGMHVLPGDMSYLGRGAVDWLGLGPGSELRGPDDVLDWTSFVDSLQRPVTAATPSPAQTIWQRLGAKQRELLVAAHRLNLKLARRTAVEGETRQLVERLAGQPDLSDEAQGILDEARDVTLPAIQAEIEQLKGDVARRRADISQLLNEKATTAEIPARNWPDVTDWPGLIAELISPRHARVPTVDQAVRKRLTPQRLAQLPNFEALRKTAQLPIELLPENATEAEISRIRTYNAKVRKARADLKEFQRTLVREINGLLPDEEFFNAEAWANMDVPPEQVARLDHLQPIESALGVAGPREAREMIVAFNRECLNVAYRGLIAEHLRGERYWGAYTRGLSAASYMMVFKNPEIVGAYGVTVARTIVGTLLTLIATCIAAYPLSRPYLPHRRVFTFFILFTMIFSGGMVPVYMLIKSLGLIDNFLVYVIPGALSAFNIIIVKNFFQSIPESLGESARIDGAGEFGILFRIYIPLSKPVLATVALWTAVTHWNMWFDNLLYVYSPRLQTLQLLLRRIVIENSTELVEKGLINPDRMTFTPETIKAATVIVTILPILLVYPFLQKYFVKGILLGGVKE